MLNQTPPSILIVDDELDNLYLVASYLDAEGFEVLVASNSEDCLESAELAQPDLILLDVIMPRVDGFTTCRLLKENPKTADIPVIFLTALSGVQHKQTAYEVGGIDYITQPIQKQELLLRVKSHLKLRSLQKTLAESNNALQVEIKKRHHNEHLLEIAKKNAEKANQAKSEFLANMSHEIRTPMNAILGFADILRPLLELDEQRRYLDNIRDSSHALLDLINDILDLSKVESGKLTLSHDKVDVRDLCYHLQQIFAQTLTQKDVQFVVDVPDDLPGKYWLDRSRLQQVLLNLLANAAKFTHQGSITLKISSRYYSQTTKRQACLDFKVIDTGIGIAKDEQDKIFEPFKQQSLQSYSDYGGTGLGLSITRSLVELMHGHIYIESDVGKGSCFQVELHHVEVVHEDEEVKPALSSPKNYQSWVFAPATVLLVDDVPLNRELIKEYLSSYPFNIIEAGDGEEAINLAKQHLPDLVLMDIIMPKIDGEQATTELKQMESTSHIPVLAITAAAMVETEERLRKLCDGFLKKPLEIEILINTLATFLPCERQILVEPQTKEPDSTTPELIEPNGKNIVKLQGVVAEHLRNIWQSLDETSSLNDLFEFAEQVQHLGEQQQDSYLNEWAEKLHQRILLFDMPKTFEYLQTFEDFLPEAANV